ncbi:MAG: LysM domain-containing protein [Actinomycetaceae bacterium]|nr:LysM domain-containing protein [Actinomycetaceae bacterium]
MEQINRISQGLVTALAALAFTAITLIASAIIIETMPVVRVFLANPSEILSSSISANASALPLTVALVSLVIAALSIWSLASLIVAETALFLASRGAEVGSLLRGAVKFSSPLVRPLLKKRIATVALTASIMASGSAAFASPSDEIPTNISWQAVATAEQELPTDLSFSPTATPIAGEEARANPASDQSNAKATPRTSVATSNTSVPASGVPASAAKSSTDTTVTTKPEGKQPAATATATQTATAPKSGPAASSKATASKAAASTSSSTSQNLQASHAKQPGQQAASTQNVKDAQTASTYVVQPGDSLWTIASKHFETASPSEITRGWHLIYELNKDAIGDTPDLIYPGLTLNLPGKEL